MRVLIVGAGPAGLLLANYLIRRPGYHVHIIDRQPNPHTLLPESLWSYPIVLQSRGLEALRFVDAELETAMKQQGMHASSACFHKKGGKVQKNSMGSTDALGQSEPDGHYATRPSP